ncbi:hypothetical protein CYMTET_16800 [Cymbomonas tetramitiformis]|uniref:Uncharacterized protein n=1 Tax=Cymbomonas tetramitiformis TaxID=36881 RepID=A0AAE0GB79_9CHLO|nr:hypothetical protein CYMTET_16800 [Cymbomonas tetramitiformis]
MVKGKSYSQATTPSPPGGAPASEEKPSESSLRDIEMRGQQEQISALTEMMKGMSAQLYELRGLSQTVPRATVPVDQHLNSLPAGGQRPLPSLPDMTKGLSAESYFSGKETDQEGIWDEWLAKIRPSLRHPSLALLLSESTPLHMVRGDDFYLEEANQLSYDFLCRVTTGTANAVVRSYGQHSDGHGAWLELSKLRRNTSVVYFINQVDKLLLLPNRLSRLDPPLPTFLESKETLRRLREYSMNARVTPPGKPLCMETVETIYSAMAIVRLHPDYMLLKAKFMLESLPTASMLSDQVTSHYDTILAPRAAVTHSAHAVNHTGDNSESEAAGKVPCSICHRRGHPSTDCFIKNVEKREAFFEKASPSTKAAILKKVADYERHGKLPKPGEHLGAAARQSELYPGLEESGEVLFALREAGQSDLHPGLDETGEDIYAGEEEEHSDTGGTLFALRESGQTDLYPGLEDTGEALFALGEGGRSGLHSGLEDTGETFFALREAACRWNNEHTLPTSVTSDFSDVPVTPFHLVFGSDPGKSALVDPPSSGLALSNNYSVLDRVLAVPTDATACCAKVAGGVVDPDLRLAPRSTMDKSAVLDCGATKHIFDSMKVYTEDDDGDHFGDNFDDSIPDLDSGSDSHEDDDPEACQVGLSGHPELYPGLRVDILTTYPVMIK